LSTASSKCYLDHAASNISINTMWDRLLSNSYLFFQLIGRIGSGFFRDLLRFLGTFQGNCKGNYSRLLAYILSFVVTRVYSHEMQVYVKLCPIHMF
jgi:hypothetical protein